MDEKKCCTVINQYYGCCGNNGNIGIGSENVYSTEETVCGKWIDGKPIYRKVITGKLATENGIGLVFAKVPELNIDRVIELYGNMTDNHEESHITLPTNLNHSGGLSGAINMAYNIQEKAIKYHFLNNQGYFSGCTAYVVIEYTKQDAVTTA